MLKALDVPKETLERMSFEEKYEGYVLDLVKYLSEEVGWFLSSLLILILQFIEDVIIAFLGSLLKGNIINRFWIKD